MMIMLFISFFDKENISVTSRYQLHHASKIEVSRGIKDAYTQKKIKKEKKSPPD
jgi:hypothetical protein